MQKKHLSQIIFLLLITVSGILLGLFSIHHFFAGLITGGAGNLLIFSLIGRRIANKAAATLDKRVRDIIVEK